MTTTVRPDPNRPLDPPIPFARIVCGVDGSRPSREAALQAIDLARGGGHIRFLAITHETGYGPTHAMTLAPARAERAVQDAVELARAVGVEATGEVVDDADQCGRLAAEARELDLLVVGTHGNSRVGGIMLGCSATTLAHRTTVPLLIARQSKRALPFGERIVLAHDAADDSRTLELTARIAAACGAHVVIAHAGRCDALEREVLARAAAKLQETLGAEPVIDVGDGAPHRVVSAAIERHRASLVVCGRRGLQGVRALGSVSERLAHYAPSSVLLVPR